MSRSIGDVKEMGRPSQVTPSSLQFDVRLVDQHRRLQHRAGRKPAGATRRGPATRRTKREQARRRGPLVEHLRDVVAVAHRRAGLSVRTTSVPEGAPRTAGSDDATAVDRRAPVRRARFGQSAMRVFRPHARLYSIVRRGPTVGRANPGGGWSGVEVRRCLAESGGSDMPPMAAGLAAVATVAVSGPSEGHSSPSELSVFAFEVYRRLRHEIGSIWRRRSVWRADSMDMAEQIAILLLNRGCCNWRGQVRSGCSGGLHSRRDRAGEKGPGIDRRRRASTGAERSGGA